MTVRPAILHVARDPHTGVWSVMRQLASWQLEHGYRVGFGLLISKAWAETYHQQAAEMQRAGVEVMIGHSPKVFGTAAIAYHQFVNPIGRWATTFPRAGEPVVVHFHNAWLSGAYMPVRARDVTAVVTYHGIQGERALRVQPVRRRIHAMWAQRLVRYGARHASVDAHNVAVAHDLFGVPPDVFTVVPNGTAAPPRGVTGCPRLGDPAAPLVVGHVGVIDEGKGWRITGEAVRRLHEEGFSVAYLVAGSGPQAQDARDWCAANAAFATYLGYSRNPQAEVFPRIDVMSLPSKGEGLPMAVLEALSFSIPVIATAVGGLANVIEEERNGFLIERSADEVAARLRRLLTEPALLAGLSAGACKSHADRFSVAAMGSAYEQLYVRGSTT